MLTRSCRDSARQISVAVEMLCLLNFSMCLFTITVVLWREVWRKNMIQKRFRDLRTQKPNSCPPEVKPCPMKTIRRSLFAFGSAVCKLQASKPLASYPGRMRKKKRFSPPTQPGYEASNPLIISANDKGSSFSRGKRAAVQLPLDCLLSRKRIHK